MRLQRPKLRFALRRIDAGHPRAEHARLEGLSAAIQNLRLTWIFAYVSGVDIAKFNTIIRPGTGDVVDIAEFRTPCMQLSPRTRADLSGRLWRLELCGRQAGEVGIQACDVNQRAVPIFPGFDFALAHQNVEGGAAAVMPRTAVFNGEVEWRVLRHVSSGCCGGHMLRVETRHMSAGVAVDILIGRVRFPLAIGGKWNVDNRALCLAL